MSEETRVHEEGRVMPIEAPGCERGQLGFGAGSVGVVAVWEPEEYPGSEVEDPEPDEPLRAVGHRRRFL